MMKLFAIALFAALKVSATDPFEKNLGAPDPKVPKLSVTDHQEVDNDGEEGSGLSNFGEVIQGALDLEGKNLRDEDVKGLSKAIQDSALVELDLGFNNFDERGAIALASGLKGSKVGS